MKRFMVLVFSVVHIAVSSQPPLVFIEGNIGAGKSTFLKMLRSYMPDDIVAIIPEPCDEWQNISGHNILEAFYQDAPRWACTFQFYAMMTRVRKQEIFCQHYTKIQFMERSWYSDRYCFAQNAYEAGLLHDMEWAIYNDLWHYYIGKKNKPAAFIYVRVSPQVCYDRMQQRARQEEAVVPLSYLEQLHAKHETWLTDVCAQQGIPVLFLDGNQNFKENKDVQQDFMKQILDFLKNHEIIDFNIE